MPRAKTAEEVRKEFLEHVAGIAHYWATLPDKTPLERCNGLAFSILNVFDGTAMALPAINLVLNPHPDDEEYLKSQGEDWYEAGMCFHEDAELHSQFIQHEAKES